MRNAVAISKDGVKEARRKFRAVSAQRRDDARLRRMANDEAELQIKVLR